MFSLQQLNEETQQIIDDVGRVQETGEHPLRVYNDPEIFDVEKHTIFAHSWVLIGHETELTEPGDYAKRYIADTPLIFVRDENGDLRVFVDTCRHRGTSLVRGEQGNTSHFQCPYHGWTYANSGELVGVPKIDQVYTGLDKTKWGLLELPASTYNGLVFATLDSDGPSLDDYLGGFKWHLDFHLAFNENGFEAIGEPIRWIIDVNWKVGSENLAGDGYHIPSTHQSAHHIGLNQVVSEGGVERHFKQFICDGHATNCVFFEETPDYVGYDDETINAPNLSAKQRELIETLSVATANVFPNLSLIHVITDRPAPTKQAVPFMIVRKWHPMKANETQVWNWILAPTDWTTEEKDRAYEAAQATFSISGNYDQDDYAVWNGLTQSAGATYVGQHNVKINYSMGTTDTDAVDDLSAEWPCPGTVYDTNLTDNAIRNFLNDWYNLVNGRPINEQYA